MEKIKCFYCGQRAPTEDVDAVRHYEPCSNCRAKFKDNYILLKISKSPSKKYPDAITRIGESLVYPTGDFIVVKEAVAKQLPKFDENQKMMCLLDEAWDIVFKSSKWYARLWHFINKLYRKKILQAIIVIWILFASAVSNIAMMHGCYKPLIGFYNPIKAIQLINVTPKSDTGYIYKAGKVIVLYQWNCPDCEKSYPLLKEDFPDAYYISAQSQMGMMLRDANLSEPVQFVPTILVADFNEFYHVFVPYYNDKENNDEFIYDKAEVASAKAEMKKIRKEFNEACDELNIESDKYIIDEN